MKVQRWLVFIVIGLAPVSSRAEEFLYLPLKDNAVLTCDFRCCGFYRACNHRAIDWDTTDETTKVYASAAGVVNQVVSTIRGKAPCGTILGYGNHIIVRHPNNYTTLYAHLKHSTIRARTGDRVEIGQEIATADNTGCSTGSHLHFEVQDPSGRKVNPYGDNPNYPNCGPNALWVTCPPTPYEPPVDNDHDGYAVEDGDCNDANPRIYPNAPERCNNHDDDCDGEVDEDFLVEELGPARGLGQPCEVRYDECISRGTVACARDGRATICSAPVIEPEPERCDGRDNDCDGEIDEGLLNACGQCGSVPEELCNHLDDDCDGEIDEDFPNLNEPCEIVENNCIGQGFYVCANDQRTTYCRRDQSFPCQCQNECQSGESECVDTIRFAECVRNEAGCYVWSGVRECSNNQNCLEGRCGSGLPLGQSCLVNEDCPSPLGCVSSPCRRGEKICTTGCYDYIRWCNDMGRCWGYHRSCGRCNACVNSLCIPGPASGGSLPVGCPCIVSGDMYTEYCGSGGDCGELMVCADWDSYNETLRFCMPGERCTCRWVFEP